MRWVVDVSVAGDPAATKSFTFMADSWHKALLQARTALGDEGALGDFSIDLLKEGYRAVDPRTRRRFVIRATNADGTPQRSEPPPAPVPAPAEDGPKTRSTSFMASVGTAAIVSSRPPPPVTAPLAPAPEPAPEASTVGRTQVMAAHGSSPQMPAAAPAAAAPEAPAPAVAPIAPVSPAPVAASAPIAPKSVAPKAPPRPAQAPKPSSKGSQRPPPPAPPQQQYAATMLSRRDQEPSESSPLTYREVSYALAIGTEEPEAEAFALQMLEELKREIPEDRAARFINIAVFDEIFTGKPTISPLVVLEWKDWKGAPVARYPRKYPSAMPNSMRSSVPGPGPSLAAALKEPSQVSRAPAAASALGDMFLGPATAPGKSAAGPATSIAAAAAAPLMPGVSNPALAPQPVPSFAPMVAPQVPPASAPVEPPPAADGSAKMKTQPLSIGGDVPATNGAAAKRLSGDELIADLFEEMHAMNFHEDAVAAGYFCLDLALSKIPADGGLVHFYDVDKREYVVACARGPNAHALLLARHPDVDPFLGTAPRSRSAVIFQADGATPPRFAVFGGLKNLVVAPLWPRGRFMGAVEFINPKDGAPFTTDDANALTYIAEQLAEFIGSRGVVLDPRRITRPPPADSASAAKARS